MRKLWKQIEAFFKKLFGKKPTTEFPPEIAAVCRDEFEAAYAYFESKVGRRLERKRCVIVIIEPTHKIDGAWCIKDPSSPTGYSGGKCYGTVCKVVRNRDTGEVSRARIRHEIGHNIRVQHWGDFSHNPRFDEYFNWSHLD